MSSTDDLHTIWHEGTGQATDGGHDDDLEDDGDIYLNWRVVSTAFDGDPVNGLWSLFASDLGFDDVGEIDYFYIRINYEEQTPSRPGKPTASNIGAGGMTLSWSSVSGASKYWLERRVGDGSYVQVYCGPGRSFDDSGLTPDTDYLYRLRAGTSSASCSSTSSGWSLSSLVLRVTTSAGRFLNVDPHAQDAAGYLVDQNIVEDPPDHDLRGTSFANRVEVAAMLYRALGDGIDNADDRFRNWTGGRLNSPFSDVRTSDWWYDAVVYLAWLSHSDDPNAESVFTRDTSQFSPTATIDRSTTLKALLEAWNQRPLTAGQLNGISSSQLFSDVGRSHPFAGYIYKAKDLGIISANASFFPSDPVLRQDFFLMMHRTMVTGANVKGMNVSEPSISSIDFDHLDIERLNVPSNGDQNVEFAGQTFDWTRSEHGFYRLVVSDNASFSGFSESSDSCGGSCVEVDTTQSAFNGIALEPGRRYYWRVRAELGSVEGPWTSTFHFTTRDDPPPSFISSSVSPGSGKSGDAFTFTSSWSDPDDFVVNVRVRYRKLGGAWTSAVLEFVSGETFRKTLAIFGDAGAYECEFQASDADTASGPIKNTTSWQGRRTFVIEEVAPVYGGVDPGEHTDAATFLIDEDIIVLPGDQDLRGQDAANRAEVAAVLFRALGGGMNAAPSQFEAWAGGVPPSPFSDIADASVWFYKAVVFLANLTFDDPISVFNGATPEEPNPRFLPADIITRGTLMKALMEAWDQAPLTSFGGVTQFADVPLSHDFAGYIYKAQQLGVVKGDLSGQNFNPDNPMIRQDLFVILHRILDGGANLNGSNAPFAALQIHTADFSWRRSRPDIGRRYEQPYLYDVQSPDVSILALSPTQPMIRQNGGEFDGLYTVLLQLEISGEDTRTFVDADGQTHTALLNAAWKADGGSFIDQTANSSRPEIPFSRVLWVAPDNHSENSSAVDYQLWAYVTDNLGSEVQRKIVVSLNDPAQSSVTPTLIFDDPGDQFTSGDALLLSGRAFDPEDGENAQRGIREVRVEYSEDGGATWRLIRASIPVNEANQWRLRWTVPTFNGTLMLRATARNMSGNTDQRTRSIAVETPLFVEGVVINTHGEAIANAQVQITRSGFSDTTLSDGNGWFRFQDGLITADYNVNASIDGVGSQTAQITVAQDRRGLIRLVIDREAPLLNVSFEPDPIEAGQTLTLSLFAEEVLSGQPSMTVQPPSGPSSAVNLSYDASTNYWSAAYTPTVVGVYSISAVAQDANGNVATIDASFTADSMDRDGDGMPNAWETAQGLDPDDPADASADPDADQLTNLAEYGADTDPHNADSDGDQMPDGYEVANQLNPKADDAQADADGDQFSNLAEFFAGTDPQNAADFPQTNVAPVVVTPIPDQNAVLDQSYTYDTAVHFADPDGDALTFVATGLPTGLTMSPTGQINGTPTVLGDAVVAITVTDDGDPPKQAGDSFVLTIGQFTGDLVVTLVNQTPAAGPGQSATWTATIENLGPNDVSVISLNHAPPPALTQLQWTCAGNAGGQCAASGNGVIQAPSSLPSGGTVIYTISGVIDPAATGDLVHQLTATPLDATDPNLADNTAVDQVTLMPVADLGLTVVDSADPVTPGSAFTYTIRVNHNGPAQATDVVVTVDIPATFNLATGSGWHFVENGGTLTATTASLSPGLSSFTIDVTAPATEGPITLTAQISSNATDPQTGDNQATQVTQIAQSCVQLDVTDVDHTVVGGAVDLALQVTDHQGAAVEGLSLQVDYDPDALSFLAFDQVGTLTDGWSIVVNDTVPGRLIVIGSGLTPFSTAGDLLNLRFQVEALSEESCTQILLTDAAFNEGDPAACLGDGEICLGCLPGDVTGNGSVSAFDATQILKTVALLPTDFDPIPLCAADVTCNGSISAFDATQILKYAAQLITDLGCTRSTTPPPETHIQLDTDRVLLTDEPFNLPVRIQNESPDVSAYSLHLYYDPNLIHLFDVEATGSLTRSWTTVVNHERPGELIISAAGVEPLATEGVLINLRGRALHEGSAELIFAEVVFNEHRFEPFEWSFDIQPCYYPDALLDTLSQWPQFMTIRQLIPLLSCDR